MNDYITVLGAIFLTLASVFSIFLMVGFILDYFNIKKL